MAAASTRMLGGETIFMVDNHKYRLDFARETYGAIPIHSDDVDAAEVILEAADGRGVNGVVDAVGVEVKGSALETVMANVKLEGSSGPECDHFAPVEFESGGRGVQDVRQEGG